jgi:type I restriction enzyme R subunit
VRLAVERFSLDEDEAQQEEFRQLLRSFLRFYSFVAQVTALNDVWLEKLYAYSAWLSRLLPSRDVPPELNVTDDMLKMSAFKLEEQESGAITLGTATLSPITEFGTSYTEEEEKSLSQIIESFNERHGTNFTREDFERFERVNREILNEDMMDMIRNNPADVVYNTFSQAFFQGMVRAFQGDSEMRNIIMTDPQARDQATRFSFARAQKQAMGN